MDGGSSKRRHALVVGGTRGIGRAVVRRFAADGYAVSLLGRHESPEAELDGVTALAVDATDTPALEQALADAVGAHGPVAALVLLQRFRGGLAKTTAADDWEGELAVSLTATRNVVEGLGGRFDPRGAAIVLVTSIASRFIAAEQPVGYHATKAALTQMARYYAATLGRKGIRVNSVAPGAVIKDESRGWYEEDAELVALYGGVGPLGRTGTSEEIAGAVAFLCGPDASFVNGQELVVDGGLSVLWQEGVARRAAGLDRALTAPHAEPKQ